MTDDPAPYPYAGYTPPSGKFASGYLQTLDFSVPGRVVVDDEMYGTHTITEAVLVALLGCASLQRLRGVGQHGITGLLGLTPPVTRLEHSVGAMILVRAVGASLAEQIAGLLHDISHTVLSHVIDWALSAGTDSFHEVHKDRYVATTEIPAILTQFGYALHSTPDTPSVMDEERFPLVERPAPHLCADRLDYGLRDSVSFGKLSREDARGVFAALAAHPDVHSASRLLVVRDPQLALRLAQAYMASDRDVWSNPAHVDMYRRSGKLIGEMVRSGAVPEEQLWRLSDAEFWAILRARSGPEGVAVLDALESGPPNPNGLALPRAAKVRTIDPDIDVGDAEPRPLSSLLPEWKEERAAYIASREAQRCSD